MSFFIQLLKSIYEIMADNDLILRVQRVNNSYLLESCLQTCKEFDCGGRHFGSSHAAWPSTFDNLLAIIRHQAITELFSTMVASTVELLAHWR